MCQALDLMTFAHQWLERLDGDLDAWEQALGRAKSRLEEAPPTILEAKLFKPRSHWHNLYLKIIDDGRHSAAVYRSFEKSLDGLVPGLYVRLSLQDEDALPLQDDRLRELVPWVKENIEEHLDPIVACYWRAGELEREGQRWLIKLPVDTPMACQKQVETIAAKVFELLFSEPSKITLQHLEKTSLAEANVPSRSERMQELMAEIQTSANEQSSSAAHATNISTAYKTSSAEDKKGKRRKYQKVGQNGLLWGRMPRDAKAIAIRDFDLDLRDAVLEGEVANREWREVRKGESYLVKFSLYSQRGSVDAQFFMNADKANEIGLFDAFQNGDRVRVFAQPKINTYSFRQELMADVKGMAILPPAKPRTDNAMKKRVELHCHTCYSERDALSKPSKLIKLAQQLGHPAIAITDHGVVQAFPEIMQTIDRMKKDGKDVPKIIYGMEGYLVNDGPTFIFGKEEGWTLGDQFVAFDLETTGLDAAKEKIIEVGAIRYVKDESGGYQESEVFHEFCDPGFTPDEKIFKLTGLKEMDLIGRRSPFEVITDFHAFLGDDPVVAHNGLFDLAFLRYEGFNVDERKQAPIKFNPVLIDTLEFSRLMMPQESRHRLEDAAKRLGISQDNKHRAVDDARTSARVFLELWKRAKFEPLAELELSMGHLPKNELKSQRVKSYHFIQLAKTRLGIYHLYRLVSLSHIDYFYKRPRIPRSCLKYFGAGLMTGSACSSGEVYQGVLKRWIKYQGNVELVQESLADNVWRKGLRLYDYLEIQPTANNHYLLRESGNYIKTDEDLQTINKLIIQLAKRYHKPIVATCDAHFINAEDEIYRRLMLDYQHFSDVDEPLPLYYRTTEEMFAEFNYLPEDLANELIVETPNKIAEQIDGDLRPFPEGNYPPIIESAPADVKALVKESGTRLYGRNSSNDGPGEILPKIVQDRVDRELSSIIENGFAIMYYIAHLLVKKSNEDGYIVGSRGSVGSSLIATFCGITEVNPLPPHYRCPACHYSEFDESGTYGSGFDLPEKSCPECGEPLVRDGQDIPFETFLGFHGDKQPDIDLNFSGEYQARAHEYTRELFGEDYTYRAGTITTFAEKNALQMARGYLERRDRMERFVEQRRLASGVDGVKSSTGQHPGGIVVIPKDREIYDFTPIQYPANDETASMYTTHFDFHALEETILKLDILGHVDPTMLRVLSDFTGVDVMTIPIPDKKVMSLFTSTEALGIPDGTAPWKTATLGIPELGTFMARGMVEETEPTRFFDLVQLMGLSHGTDVWRGNAQDLINSGTCTIDEVIGCRDSIMTSLIYMGLPSKDAFSIMEHVRKGKGLTEDEENLMVTHDVPDWYIKSCKKIKYMFPKAHAVAYVMSSLRIAWFKVYHPVAYYAAYFTVRAKEFDAELMLQSPEKVQAELERMLQNRAKLKDRELKVFYILELVAEMQLRGIEFLPIDIDRSDAYYFRPEGENKIRPPFDAITGFSTNMAKDLVKAREDGPFKSKTELMQRAGLGQSSIDLLESFHVLDGMPDSPQIDLFEFLNEGVG